MLDGEELTVPAGVVRDTPLLVLRAIAASTVASYSSTPTDDYRDSGMFSGQRRASCLHFGRELCKPTDPHQKSRVSLSKTFQLNRTVLCSTSDDNSMRQTDVCISGFYSHRGLFYRFRFRQIISWFF